ncbi:MAG: glycosyl transferase family 1 [Alphaproteobacteria bacterium]|nr:glycosyl transferase family 1 [Alphaproteobacteria bacterium]
MKEKCLALIIALLFTNVMGATPDTRVAVFAHYDQKNVISDHVIYYLKELKKVASNIIFVSDCHLGDTEKDKIKNLVLYIISYKHGEHDFGSYKRGYNYLKNHKVFKNAEELIFCNDSCLGPLFSFDIVWTKMDTQKCDFWGMTKFVHSKNKRRRHVQSYFVVFHRNVFASKVFDAFVTSITKQPNKEEIVQKYEEGMSVLLEQNGFTLSSYLDDRMSYEWCSRLASQNPINPLVKVQIFMNNFGFVIDMMLNKMNEQIRISYPKNLIESYVKQVNSRCGFFEKSVTLFKSILNIHLSRGDLFWFGKRYKLF